MVARPGPTSRPVRRRSTSNENQSLPVDWRIDVGAADKRVGWLDEVARSRGRLDSDESRPLLDRRRGRALERDHAARRKEWGHRGCLFLDTRSGWALLRAGSKLVPGKSDAQPQFDLSSTTDAGTTWQTFHVTVPPQVIEPYSDGADVPDLTGQGKIAFADRLHGWMNLSSGNYRGTLLNTSDGGRSWKQAPGDRVKWASYIVPVTPEEGWMVAGGSSDELYVTRDGAKSFDDVSLVAPERGLRRTSRRQHCPFEPSSLRHADFSGQQARLYSCDLSR